MKNFRFLLQDHNSEGSTLSKASLFKKEINYLFITIFLSIITTIYLYSKTAQEIVNISKENSYVILFSRIPAASFPEWIKQIDTVYWEAFYQLQFSLMPIPIILGFIGSFHHSARMREKLKNKTTWMHLVVVEICVLFSLMVIASSNQLAEGFPVQINYWNKYFLLPQLTLTWVFASLMFYAIGSALGAPIQKYKLSKVKRI